MSLEPAEQLDVDGLIGPEAGHILSEEVLVAEGQRLGLGADFVQKLLNVLLARFGSKLGPLVLKLLLDWLSKIKAHDSNRGLYTEEASVRGLLDLFFEKIGPVVLEKLLPLLMDKLIPVLAKMLTDWLNSFLAKL